MKMITPCNCEVLDELDGLTDEEVSDKLLDTFVGSDAAEEILIGLERYYG